MPKPIAKVATTETPISSEALARVAANLAACAKLSMASDKLSGEARRKLQSFAARLGSEDLLAERFTKLVNQKIGARWRATVQASCDTVLKDEITPSLTLDVACETLRDNLGLKTSDAFQALLRAQRALKAQEQEQENEQEQEQKDAA